uniref:Zgc:165604 n=1 Tax=Gasterosteus aculeatus aculeatus TaxID=481459 RepID=A0AAQ4S197_GASAC
MHPCRQQCAAYAAYPPAASWALCLIGNVFYGAAAVVYVSLTNWTTSRPGDAPHRSKRSPLLSASAMGSSSGRWIVWTLCVCFTALQNGDRVRPRTGDRSALIHWPGIPWSADIALNDTRVPDAGTYRCMVTNPPEAADPGIGELELSVLAPPSLPECQWDGDIGTGGSVTLSCSVEDGVPRPEIRWDKVNPGGIALPINIEGDLSGSVQIVNVSSETSGLYRCSANNVLGTENCYVNVSVHAPPDRSSGLLQAVLIALSMSSVLAALLALVLWLHRTGQDGRGEEEEEQEEEEECYNEIRYTPSLMKRSFV